MRAGSLPQTPFGLEERGAADSADDVPEILINNRYIDLITGIFQAEDAEILKVEILVRTATRSVRPTSPPRKRRRRAIRPQPRQCRCAAACLNRSARWSPPACRSARRRRSTATVRCSARRWISLHLRDLRRGLVEPRGACRRKDHRRGRSGRGALPIRCSSIRPWVSARRTCCRRSPMRRSRASARRASFI